MDLFKLRRKQTIGEEAQRLLDNELLNRWWENREKTLWERFKNANPYSDEVALIKMSMDAQTDMKGDLKRYVSEGKHAAQQAKEAESKEK